MYFSRVIGYWCLAYILGMIFDLLGSFSEISTNISYLIHLYASLFTIILFIFFSYYWTKQAFKKLHYAVKNAAWTVGIIWVVLTIVSDLLFWHHIYGVEIKTLLRLYSLGEGNFRLLLLVVQIFAPRIIAGIKVRIYRKGRI
ncbi:MAG: hypothetical protein HQ591_07360 [candidate division Zixibacteria bacterium]|nr:hypothetical protein [Candidatus Tariuqbacter arcticus]